ncbi:TPA: hypothetical protein EYP66_12175 [Candidatus Poribacteria bacterium]|nr:hypothetical protein [Candidatus Poribacteria bacterium]
MIFLIAKKELIDNWQSRKIVLAFALCAILFSVSFYLALKDYSGRLESYSLSRESWDGRLGNLPHKSESWRRFPNLR